MKPEECPRDDCRFAYGPGSTTLLGWAPVYDKHGKQLNSDPNTTRYPTDCRTCGKSWESVTRSGKTIIRSLDMDDLDRRRLNRLNAEYKQSPDYIEPVFSSRLKFAISVFVLTIFALVTMIIIDG